MVLRQAHEHPEARVRLACFKLLYTSFADDPQARTAIVRLGLTSEDERIRYEAAFHVGALRIHESYERLRKFLETLPPDEVPLRVTAAKSLAELGEGDAIRHLSQGMIDDSYMPRHMADAGLKALSGKRLGDFEGYDHEEGAFVTGGIELQFPFDAIQATEREVKRFSAAAADLRWLKAERPDLYKHLAPRL